jgi:anti-sigma regulatory factor (Ser/Thr protein kinase)
MGASGTTREDSRPTPGATYEATGHDIPGGRRETPGGEPTRPAGAPARRRAPLIELLSPGSAVRRARSVLGAILERAGVDEDRIRDAQLIVMELTANAERHACPPYELRVHGPRGVPAWCEVVDAAPDLGEIRALLARPALLGDEPVLPLAELLAENGRGLLLAQRLSDGTCRAYPTRLTTTGAPAKAIAFALPVAPLPAAAVPAEPMEPRRRRPTVER